MSIDRLPVLDVNPMWSLCIGDRYVSHPELRTAMIQLKDDPEYVYMVADEALPDSIESAVNLVHRWRDANETASD